MTRQRKPRQMVEVRVRGFDLVDARRVRDGGLMVSIATSVEGLAPRHARDKASDLSAGIGAIEDALKDHFQSEGVVVYEVPNTETIFLSSHDDQAVLVAKVTFSANREEDPHYDVNLAVLLGRNEKEVHRNLSKILGL